MPIRRPPSRPHWARTRRRKATRLVRREIADRRTGIEEQAALRRARVARQRQAAGKIHAQRPSSRCGGKRCCRRSSGSRRNSAEMSTGTYWAGCSSGNRRAALAQLPAPRSISVAPVADGARDLGAVRVEDRRFGAGRIVLGQLADGFEQARAERVVQELGRDAGVGRGQAGADFGDDGGAAVGGAWRRVFAGQRWDRRGWRHGGVNVRFGSRNRVLLGRLHARCATMQRALQQACTECRTASARKTDWLK